LRILEGRPDLTTVVIPTRIYDLGLIAVAGIAMLVKVRDSMPVFTF
jgi:hypothetical protein